MSSSTAYTIARNLWRIRVFEVRELIRVGNAVTFSLPTPTNLKPSEGDPKGTVARLGITYKRTDFIFNLSQVLT